MVLWLWALLLGAGATHSMVCALQDLNDRAWFGFWASWSWALAQFAGAGCIAAVAWS
jgi:hypothetical protein